MSLSDAKVFFKKCLGNKQITMYYTGAANDTYLPFEVCNVTTLFVVDERDPSVIPGITPKNKEEKIKYELYELYDIYSKGIEAIYPNAKFVLNINPELCRMEIKFNAKGKNRKVIYYINNFFKFYPPELKDSQIDIYCYKGAPPILTKHPTRKYLNNSLNNKSLVVYGEQKKWSCTGEKLWTFNFPIYTNLKEYYNETESVMFAIENMLNLDEKYFEKYIKNYNKYLTEELNVRKYFH